LRRELISRSTIVSTTAGDVAYFESMLDSIERDQCIDRGRVFVTGFSMGGYMSNPLGCQLGRAKLRAIARIRVARTLALVRAAGCRRSYRAWKSNGCANACAIASGIRSGAIPLK
jgi:poly(3-hydroxybutyrate) depolymerase